MIKLYTLYNRERIDGMICNDCIDYLHVIIGNIEIDFFKDCDEYFCYMYILEKKTHRRKKYHRFSTVGYMKGELKKPYKSYEEISV